MKKFNSPFPTHLETSLLRLHGAESPTDGPPGERIELFPWNPWSILGFGSQLSNEGNTKNAIYSWASLVSQMVKNLPTTQETWVWSLCQDDPLKKEMAQTTSVFLPEEFYGQRSLGGYSPWGPKVLDMTERFSLTHKILPSTIDYWLLHNFNLTTLERVEWILSFSQLENPSPWDTKCVAWIPRKCWPWNLDDSGLPEKPT